MERDVLGLAGPLVEAGNQALVVAGVHNVRVWRIGRNVTRLSAAYRVPIGTIDGTVVAAAGDGDGAIVLLRAIDVVRRTSISNDVIELCRRLIVIASTGAATIQAHGVAAIVGNDHATWILRVNPHAMIIAVR